MDSLPASRLRRTLPPLALMSTALVLFGCGPGHPKPPVKETSGAVLTASKVQGMARETVTFDAVGSTLADSEGTCPTRLYFFVDDTPLPDGEATPQTLAVDGNCKVTRGAVPMQLPAGEPGSTRDQTVSVMVEGEQDGKLYKSKAEVVVEVTTAAAGTPPAPSGSTTQPTTQPTSAPTEDPHGGGSRCGFNEDPSAPQPAFVVNPMPPVAGQALEVNARQSSDDGHIVAYRFDWGNDGTFDVASASSTASYTPAAAGEFEFCLEVEDDTGKTNHHAGTVPVAAVGSLRAEAFHASPAGSTVHFFPEDVADAESFGLDADADGTFEQFEPRTPGGSPPSFSHAYAAPGVKEVRMLYVDEDTSPAESSQWTSFVEVTASRPAPIVPRAAAAAAKAKTRSHFVGALLDQAQDTVLAPGRRTYADGVLSVDGVVIRSRSKGKLDKAQAAALPRRLRRGLKALYNADFVARFSGRRVVLTPDAWGLAGRATMLARSRKGKRTRVCLSVETDGATLLGTTFKVLGATGRAAGMAAAGHYPPPVLGPRPGEKPMGTAVVQAGRRTGISKCKALVRYLPKAKKKKRR